MGKAKSQKKKKKLAEAAKKPKILSRCQSYKTCLLRRWRNDKKSLCFFHVKFLLGLAQQNLFPAVINCVA
jgi:hypothetical protein